MAPMRKSCFKLPLVLPCCVMLMFPGTEGKVKCAMPPVNKRSTEILSARNIRTECDDTPPKEDRSSIRARNIEQLALRMAFAPVSLPLQKRVSCGRPYPPLTNYGRRDCTQPVKRTYTVLSNVDTCMSAVRSRKHSSRPNSLYPVQAQLPRHKCKMCKTSMDA
jgi:hypothetical protein